MGGVKVKHNGKWIQTAVKHPGALTKKAKAAGLSVQQYAAQVSKPGSKASSTTKKQAALAKTFRKMSKKRKKNKGKATVGSAPMPGGPGLP